MGNLSTNEIVCVLTVFQTCVSGNLLICIIPTILFLFFCRGTTFSNLRNRRQFPTAVVLGNLQYQAYATMAQQLMVTYNWTSTSIIFDDTLISPFFSLAAHYIIHSIRQSDQQLDTQIFSFPVNSLKGIDFNRILKEIGKLSRSTDIAVTSCRHPVTHDLIINLINHST